MQNFVTRLKASAFGWAFVGMGVFMGIYIPLNPEGANAPMWVIEVAAAAFFFAGLSFVLQAFALPWLARISVVVLAYLLAIPGLWMLFDAQGAQCSGSVSVLSVSFAQGANDITCRVVFGLGGLLTLGFAIAMTWVAIKNRNAKQVDGPST